MLHRALSTVVAAALVAGAAVQAAPVRAQADEKAAKRPNVVLVVIDTLRADHLSAYGYQRTTSPNLDRLAGEGLLYETAVSAASWTLPSHASLFTGLYPRDHGTNSQNQQLSASFDTLAEKLAEAGYRTGGFSNNVWLNEASGLQQGFDTFRELWHEQEVRTKGISFDDVGVDMGAARTTEQILDWIGGLGEHEPFFVFVNYFEPHLPYRPTKPHHRDFLPEHSKPLEVERLRSFYSPREFGHILRHPLMTVKDRDLEILTALYDAEIAYTDRWIGRLVAGLEKQGRLDETLLVITSDHGEHLGEKHMLSHKLSIYEPLLLVPLILRHPGLIAAGGRIESQVQAHDLFGTILELTGVTETASFRLPLEEPSAGGPDGGPRQYTFAELAYPQIFLDVIADKLPGWSAKPFARALTAVRTERYKLIRGSDGSLELYDVRQDPFESQDLSTAEPAVVKELGLVLDAFENNRLW